jgi:hypothetical protein
MRINSCLVNTVDARDSILTLIQGNQINHIANAYIVLHLPPHVEYAATTTMVLISMLVLK